MAEEDRREDQRREDWHRTRGVFITIITLLLTNLVTSVWWAATLTSDVNNLKKKPDLEERVIKLEAASIEHSKWINKIDNTIDRNTRALETLSREQVVTQTILKGMKK